MPTLTSKQRNELKAKTSRALRKVVESEFGSPMGIAALNLLKRRSAPLNKTIRELINEERIEKENQRIRKLREAKQNKEPKPIKGPNELTVAQIRKLEREMRRAKRQQTINKKREALLAVEGENRELALKIVAEFDAENIRIVRHDDLVIYFTNYELHNLSWGLSTMYENDVGRCFRRLNIKGYHLDLLQPKIIPSILPERNPVNSEDEAIYEKDIKKFMNEGYAVEELSHTLHGPSFSKGVIDKGISDNVVKFFARNFISKINGDTYLDKMHYFGKEASLTWCKLYVCNFFFGESTKFSKWVNRIKELYRLPNTNARNEYIHRNRKEMVGNATFVYFVTTIEKVTKYLRDVTRRLSKRQLYYHQDGRREWEGDVTIYNDIAKALNKIATADKTNRIAIQSRANNDYFRAILNLISISDSEKLDVVMSLIKGDKDIYRKVKNKLNKIKNHKGNVYVATYLDNDVYREEDKESGYYITKYSDDETIDMNMRTLDYRHCDNVTEDCYKLPGTNLSISRQMVYRNNKGDLNKVYGDNIYKISPPSEGEGKDWVDNSKSGNLCIITSLVYNPIIREAIIKNKHALGLLSEEGMSKLNMDDLVLQLVVYIIARINNTLIDGKALKGAITDLYKTGKFINKTFLSEKTLLINMYNERQLTGVYNCDKGFILKSRKAKEEYYEEIIEEPKGRSKKGKTVFKLKDEYVMVDVIISNGHIFTVCSEEHRKHIMKEIVTETKIESANKVNIVNEQILTMYDEMFSVNKSLWNAYLEFNDPNTYKLVKYYSGPEEVVKRMGEIYDEYKQEGKAKDYVMDYEYRRLKLVLSKMNQDIMYYAYDLETTTNDDNKATIYEIVVRNIMTGNKYHIVADKDSNNNDLHYVNYEIPKMVFEMIGWICNDCNGYNMINAPRARTVKEIEEGMNEYKVPEIKLFAHNGGGFDNLLVMREILNFNSNPIVKIENISDIYAGGKYKMIQFEVKYDLYNNVKAEETVEIFKGLDTIGDMVMKTQYIIPKSTGASVTSAIFEYDNVQNSVYDSVDSGRSSFKYKFQLMDSFMLTNVPIKNMAKDLKLDVSNFKKGTWVYKTITWLHRRGLIGSIKKVRDLRALNMPTPCVEEYENLVKELELNDDSEIDLLQLSYEYCDQDVNIMCEGLRVMKSRFHNINKLSEVMNIDNYIENDKGVLVYEKNEKLRFMKWNFLECMTIPGAVRKMAKLMLMKSRRTYNGINYEYMNVSTGGIVNYDMIRYQKPPKALLEHENLIVTNPDVIRYLSKHGYDVNKPRKRYDINKKEEVNSIRSFLEEEVFNYALLSIDANSLYPSAAYEVCRVFGGFPVGDYTKLESSRQMEDKLVENKRMILYMKVHFTKKGRDLYNELDNKVRRGKELMREYYETGCNDENKYEEAFSLMNTKYPLHQLIIRTDDGNRCMTPKDADEGLSVIGMTDIMYRNYLDHEKHGLYTLEYVNGIYWEESTTELGNMFHVMMKTRNNYSKDDPMNKTIKLWMNSFYGMLLQKPHPTTVTYYDARDGFAVFTRIEADEVKNHLKALESKSSYEKKKLQIKNENRVGKYDRIESYSLERLRGYEGYPHWGSIILDMSKYIMFRYISKIEGNLYYMDTDSLTGSLYDFVKLMKDDKKLVEETDGYDGLFGDDLGQSKLDFNEKALKGTQQWKQENDVMEPFDKDIGAMSVSHVFLGKKMYAHLFLVQVRDKDTGMCHLDLTYSATCKGHNLSNLTYEDFVYAADSRKAIEQNRGAIKEVFITPSAGKLDEGIMIKNHDDDDGCMDLTRRLSNALYNDIKSIKNEVEESRKVKQVKVNDRKGVEQVKGKEPKDKFTQDRRINKYI